MLGGWKELMLGVARGNAAELKKKMWQGAGWGEEGQTIGQMGEVLKGVISS